MHIIACPWMSSADLPVSADHKLSCCLRRLGRRLPEPELLLTTQAFEAYTATMASTIVALRPELTVEQRSMLEVRCRFERADIMCCALLTRKNCTTPAETASRRRGGFPLDQLQRARPDSVECHLPGPGRAVPSHSRAHIIAQHDVCL